MKKLFYPKSIAVFGVSEKQDNFGRNIVKNLLDFQFEGEIYPVGTKEGTVYGLEIYPGIEAVPAVPDLVVFLIPAKFVMENFKACVEKGVKRMMISSGGFSELNRDQKGLEQELLDIAAANDVRFLGPNCIAAINQDIGMCLPFVRMRHFENGPVSVLTQSGGVGLSIINIFNGQNLGINKYVSLGNKLNISESDMVPFLDQDESTGTICFYLEEMGRGRAFLDAVRGCSKPIVVLKTNVEPETAKVALSHTAAIANDDRVVDSVLRQVGVVRVPELEDLAAACKVFNLPPMKGNRVAVITPTGGFAVILADMCARYGFQLPDFPQSFLDEVSRHVRAGVIPLANPLDLGDMFNFEMVAHTVTQAMREEEFDALVLSWILLRDIGVGIDSVNIFPQLERMVKHFNKPVVLSMVGDPVDVAHMRKMTKFPVFSTPEESIKALAALRDFTLKTPELRSQKPVIRDIDEKKIRGIIDAARGAGHSEIGMVALEILDACGIPAQVARLCATADEAAAAAAELGFPVAMKIASADILHKTEAGGVRLKIQSEEECRAAFDEIIGNAREYAPDAKLDGVHVQKMSAAGREVIVGVKDNAAFGHVVAFGLGGVLVEALKDVALRAAPLGPADADALLDEIRAKKVLGNFRGMKPADANALREVFFRVSTLVTKFPEIAELDINPLMTFEEGHGCIAVDARIILSERERK